MSRANAKSPEAAKTETISRPAAIKAPNLKVLVVAVRGTSPYVMHKFGQKAINQIIATQGAGSQARGKRERAPKDFENVYKECFHFSEQGWAGVPAGAFRNAMISACRTVGFRMTHAKLAAFVLADGYDDKGNPLVRIHGEPERHTTYARNANGQPDIRVRPMWKEWSMSIRIRFDADMFSADDITNLMMRVGMQVGIGEGRPDSKNSAGMGWGLFEVVSQEKKVAQTG